MNKLLKPLSKKEENSVTQVIFEISTKFLILGTISFPAIILWTKSYRLCFFDKSSIFEISAKFHTFLGKYDRYFDCCRWFKNKHFFS